MFKTIKKWLWKFYKGFCYFMGGLTLLYFFVLALMLISNQLERGYLPSGKIYIAKNSFFSTIYDIGLYRRNGTPIYDKAIDLICFNDDFIYVVTNYGGSFLYDIQKDEVMYDDFTEEYRQIKQDSKLFTSTGRCDGYFTVKMGPDLFLNKMHYLKKPAPYMSPNPKYFPELFNQ